MDSMEEDLQKVERGEVPSPFGEIQYSEINGHFIRLIHEKTDRPQTLNIAQQAVDILGYPRNKEDKIFQGLKYSAWTNLKLSKWIMRPASPRRSPFIASGILMQYCSRPWARISTLCPNCSITRMSRPHRSTPK